MFYNYISYWDVTNKDIAYYPDLNFLPMIKPFLGEFLFKNLMVGFLVAGHHYD